MFSFEATSNYFFFQSSLSSFPPSYCASVGDHVNRDACHVKHRNLGEKKDQIIIINISSANSQPFAYIKSVIGARAWPKTEISFEASSLIDLMCVPQQKTVRSRMCRTSVGPVAVFGGRKVFPGFFSLHLLRGRMSFDAPQYRYLPFNRLSIHARDVGLHLLLLVHKYLKC